MAYLRTGTAGGPATGPTVFPVQGRSNHGATPISHQYRCSKCAISYDVPRGDQAKCPMCALERQLRHQELALQDASHKIRGLQAQLEGLVVQVDHVAAIRQALEAISSEDLAWIKGALYRYREDRSLQLMASHSAMFANKSAKSLAKARDTFVLVQRGQDNEIYKPNSIGGAAIVGYFDEITRESGARLAMSYLLRALSLTLSGGKP